MRLSFIALYITFALAASASSGTPTAKPASDARKIHASVTIIPFQYDADSPLPVLIVQVKIDHQPPLPFAVDTGASTTLVIDSQAAKRLKLPIGQKHVIDVQHGPVAVYDSSVRRLTIIGNRNKGINCNIVPTIVMDLSYFDLPAVSQDNLTGQKIAGFIGNKLLTSVSMPMLIDFTGKYLIFLTLKVPLKSVISSASAVIPLTLDSTDGNYYLNAPYADGKSIKFLLDTGSNTSEIHDFSNFSAVLNSTKILFQDDIIGPPHFQDSIQLPKLMFGSFVVPNMSFILDPSPVGTRIGLDFLSRFLVIIDLPHKLLVLRPRDEAKKSSTKQPIPLPASPQPPLALDSAESASNVATLGVSFGLYNHRFLADTVGASSPAALCGLKPGDQITDLNGKAMANLTPEQIKKELNKSEATLMVWRGNTKEWREFYLAASYFFRKDADPPAPPSPALANQVWKWFPGAGYATTIDPNAKSLPNEPTSPPPIF